jgi:signal transduction histidine kinase
MLRIHTQPSLSRHFLLLSLFIVAILVLVSAWVTSETIDNHAASVIKQMENDALRVDRALIVETENASYILESLGRQIQATGLNNDEAIAQLFFSFAKSEGTKRNVFSWVNKNQSIIIASNLGVLEKPIDVSDRDYVKKSIAEPWKVHIGRPIFGRLSQKMVLPLSLGLTDKNGTYSGSVVIALDIQLLTEDIGRGIKDSGTQYAITNLALTLLTQTPASEKFFTSNFDLKRLAAIDFSARPSGVYSRGTLFSNKRIFSYYERSSQYPFLIFLGIDTAHSKALIVSMLLPRLFQLTLIALFMLFLLWMVRSRIIQPVLKLTHDASSIVRGEKFDPESTHGPLEIEQLSYEIKRLYDYIEERRRVESELRLKNADLTRIKEAAQLTNQVKAEFFSYVGQELTEPVEVIIEQIETIKDQHFGPVGNQKYIVHANEVYDHAQQLLAMLADIKSISEAETGLLALNESEVDFNFILQKTVRIFREKNPLGVEVQMDVSAAMPRVRGDELRLKQMILNILNASAQHLASGDVIRITSSVKGQELSLNFAYVSTIADAARLKSLGALAFAGRSKHGLELALARLLVALHQGTLEMKTTADRTTTVSVKFPAMRVM